MKEWRDNISPRLNILKTVDYFETLIYLLSKKVLVYTKDKAS